SGILASGFATCGVWWGIADFHTAFGADGQLPCQFKGANRMFTRRKFLVRSASSLALTLGAGRLAKAATGGWAQQQGGSQDLQTKLVWLDYALATSLAGNTET